MWNPVSGSGKLNERLDYPNMQPACGMKNWYAVSGVKFQLQPQSCE